VSRECAVAGPWVGAMQLCRTRAARRGQRVRVPGPGPRKQAKGSAAHASLRFFTSQLSHPIRHSTPQIFRTYVVRTDRQFRGQGPGLGTLAM
jgi:hypothetical protein